MSQHPGSILHLIDTTGPGGAETVFTQLAAHTHREGYRTLAIIRGPGWVRDELERLNIETRIINCKGSFNLTFLRELIRTIRQERACLIQAHLLGSSVYASLAGLLTRTPVISTFHGHVDVSPKERLRWVKFLLIRLGSRRVIAVTQKLAAMLKSVKALDDSRVTVIPNGIDTELFTHANPPPLREEHQLPSSALVMGCLGNVRTAKNYTLAIDTVKELEGKGLDPYLFIAGDDTNSLAQQLKQHAFDLGLAHRIIWLDFYQDNAGFLKAVDMLLLTSSSEGHPLAIIQAMASGTPVISTPCGVEEIVTDNETALLSSTHSSQALADRIASLHEDKEGRQRIISAARVLARDTYSLQAMIDQYENLYCNSRRPPKKHNWLAQIIIDRFGSKRALLTTVQIGLKDVTPSNYRRFKHISAHRDRMVFVCKGNICRSAAAAFSRHSDIDVATAGLNTHTGNPGNERITALMSDNGYDMSNRRTMALTDLNPLPSDFYIYMDSGHPQALAQSYPNAAIALLGTITSPKQLYHTRPLLLIRPVHQRLHREHYCEKPSPGQRVGRKCSNAEGASCS
ncbi:glycosyltransferase [Marinimicrobium alkaliphilum]|uniref:glycosyltransferase n=1 Tax=Marinimicrobium alkaliphilum TaxID=2202654 RepID=UPI000DB92E98|nr:glycosyltransferase [Marinimicrobium alkaliphilum]